MPDYNNIKNAEFEIRKLQDSLASIDSARTKKKLSKQLNKLNFDQDTAVMNYLEANDKSYYDTTQENFDLLINDHIEFVITRGDAGFFTSLAKRVNGEVDDKGFFRGNTESDFTIIYQRFPLAYEGLVNYLGEADLIVVKKGYIFFGTKVPKTFIGSIDAEGKIQMKLAESYWAMIGGVYFTKIIGDFFSGNTEKREKFLENKTKLKSMIKDVRANM